MSSLPIWVLVGCGGREVESPPAPPPPAAPARTNPDQVGGVTVRPLHHGTLALEIGGRTWVVDPWSKAPLEGVSADVVLVTDIHQDHLDPAAIARVSGPDTVVVGPPAVAAQTEVDVVLANGESKEVAGARVTAVPMYNLVRGPEPGKLFHDKGRGNGYLIDHGADRVYVAGDTECTPEMKALQGVTVAFVPMNLPYTMPPEEAAACVAAFRPKVLYPYHYRGSDLSGLQAAVGDGTEVRLRDWYAER